LDNLVWGINPCDPASGYILFSCANPCLLACVTLSRRVNLPATFGGITAFWIFVARKLPAKRVALASGAFSISETTGQQEKKAEQQARRSADPSGRALDHRAFYRMGRLHLF
jgi:hypothetical protein